MPSFTVLIAVVLGIVIIILIAYGLVIYGLRDVFFAGQDIGSRLATYVTLPDESSPTQSGKRRRVGLVRIRLRMNNMLSGLASEKAAKLQLISANWPITETEFVLIRMTGTILAFHIGHARFQNGSFRDWSGCHRVLRPRSIIETCNFTTPAEFWETARGCIDLDDRCSQGRLQFTQAIEVVSKELKPPASDEFRRVRHEIGLGLSLSQALTNLVARMENDDLYLAVTAININSQVGGNIVTMLEAVTETIRERVRLFSEIRVLTAQQRFAAMCSPFYPSLWRQPYFLLTLNI